MRYLFLLILSVLSFSTMEAQPLDTFLYKLELREAFKAKAQWTDTEHGIQKDHVKYLDQLTQAGKILLAGIEDQGLKNHQGLVILDVSNYEEALTIVQNDPSIKMGMMTATIHRFNVYFLAD